MTQFLSSKPFALLGAFGLFSLISDFMAMQEDLALWVEAWRSVTRPVWDFLAGWIFRLVGIEFSWWIKDYLTVGVIHTSMTARATIIIEIEYFKKFISKDFNRFEKYAYPTILFFTLIYSIVAWPLVAYWLRSDIIPSKKNTGWKFARIYFETLVYLMVFIAVNFFLITLDV